MGLLDSMKARLGPAKGRVSGLAQRHEDTIAHGLDRAARAVDKRTRGKYSDKIQRGTGRAKGALDRLAHKDGPGPGGTGPVGTGPGGAGTAGTGPGGAGPGTAPGGATPPATPPPPVS
ncbi:antitoxin [Streptomyces sp. NPDC085946]|uniref:antitoxin n=1 Tax=Streptomyces sp. NPDC085946 TaxID=3365744 RepID=UPI0037D8F1FF